MPRNHPKAPEARVKKLVRLILPSSDYHNAAVVVMEQVQDWETKRNFCALANEVVRRQPRQAIRARIVCANDAQAISSQPLDGLPAC